MSVIAIASLKGGVAKTTTAVHLTRLVALRTPKLRPLLLDIDQNRSSRPYRFLPGCEVRAIEPEYIAQCVADNRGRLIVIDCPPSYIEARSAFDVARLILIPIMPEDAALEAAADFWKQLKAEYPHVPVRALITMNSRAADAASVIESAERKFKKRLLNTRISRHTVFRDARRAGKTVFDFLPDCLPARQFGKLGDELGLKV